MYLLPHGIFTLSHGPPNSFKLYNIEILVSVWSTSPRSLSKQRHSPQFARLLHTL